MNDEFFQEEVRSGYRVSANMKKVWSVQLDLIKVFDAVCKKFGLTYYIIYGTLLGAVRHKGYIPWDDDVDIAMPREDYEKLKIIAVDEFNYPYFLQTPESDNETFVGGCRLRNSSTLGMQIIDLWHSCNNGIFIDINAIDNYYENKMKQRWYLFKIKFYQKMIVSMVYRDEYRTIWGLSAFKTNIYRRLGKILGYRYLYKKYNEACCNYNNDKSKYLGIYTQYTGVYEYKPFYREDFESVVMLDFEGIKLPAPVGFRRVLEMSMGDDFMEYPPVDERKPHHSCIFDTNISYKVFQGRLCDTFKDIKEKKIILFGSGLMFEDYMRKYGEKYKPAFIVDNNKEKWGSEKNGIPIVNPLDILNIPSEERRVIICNIYYREIGEQLKDIGVEEYYIYIQDKNWIVDDMLKQIE